MKKLIGIALSAMIVLTLALSLGVSAADAPYYKGEVIKTVAAFDNIGKSSGTYTHTGNKVTFTGQDAATWSHMEFLGGTTFTDFIVSFKINNWTDGGVILRRHLDGNNKLQGYMVGTDLVNIYLAKYTAGAFALMNGEAFKVEGGAPFAKAFTRGSDVTLTIVVKGDIISVYVDDETTPYIQAKDSSYTSGNFGMQLKNAAEIQDFEICAIGSKPQDTAASTDDGKNTETSDYASVMIAAAVIAIAVPTVIACGKKH